ncbi:MAG: glycosyltransferase family 9 protein [Planctomycetes bacterium]|nr:glycosyltransferase family 9 protein [Planctomycetota bacterium]
MTRILIVKTAALGDVLRTTSILPGLVERHRDARITWVTARGAEPLVAAHPAVEGVQAVDPDDPSSLDAAAERLGRQTWDLLVSLDDEELVARFASRIPARARSGAFVDDIGRRIYTDDVEAWFGMGLLARDGKAAADARKRANTRSHGEIFATMLGVRPGRPELPLAPTALAAAAVRLDAAARRVRGPILGLNTGAGERWPTKAIPPERCAELVVELQRRRAGAVAFVLFGGAEEVERNAAIVRQIRDLAPRADLVDTGVANPILEFAALVSGCDLLVTSDSLGLHVAIARRVPVVAFFAPTSAAEIDVFGLGEKVVSTSPDYCSYRSDAANDSITVARLADACERVLDACATRSDSRSR